MIREWLTQRDARLTEARALLDGAEKAGRGLTDEEKAGYDGAMNEVASLNDAMRRREALIVAESVKPSMPAVNRIGRGDSEERAVAHFIRTGDRGALGELRSNATDMNIGTAADGGYAVPTGHYKGIIARRDEGALFKKLGVMPIPGKGTTVNVPVDAGTAELFVSTAEAAEFDLDASVLGSTAMTLVKFTKKIVLSDELLEDEDSNLMAFLNDYVGRALGKTHNYALVTEALANGTSVTLAAAAAATTGDPETVIYSLADEYADNAQWILRRLTEGAYRKLTGANFMYQDTPPGAARTLGGYDVNNSAYVPAIGAGNKSLIFGDFSMMGVRQGGITFLRDPYGAAATGQVRLFYYARIAYKVLQAEGILYGKHPTA